MFRSISRLALAALALPVAFLAGCESNTDSAPQKSKIRVIHSAFDAPGVDVYVNSSASATISNLVFGRSSGYAEVNPGTTNIRVTGTGSQTSVFQANVPLEAGKEYSVFALPRFATNNRIDSVIVVEDLRSASSGRSRVRFVHTSPDAPAVDIKVDNATSTPVFANTAFGKVSSSLEVESKSYSFVVTAAGGNEAVVAYEPVALESGKVYTVMAHGTLDPTDAYPFGVRVFIDNDQGTQFVDLTAKSLSLSTRIMVGHMVAGGPPVNIAYNGQEILNGFSYPSVTTYQSLAAGTGNVTVSVPGLGNIITLNDLNLKGDSSYTVFAYGDITNLASIQALVLQDDLRPSQAPNSCRLRVVHLIPGAPAVNLFTTVQGTEYAITPYNGTAYGTATAFVDGFRLPAADIIVKDANTSAELFRVPVEPGTLQVGKNYTMIIHGALTGTGENAPRITFVENTLQ